MEEGNILDLHERKDEERRKIREEKARLARCAAIQVGTRPGRCGRREAGSLASEAARRPLLCLSGAQLEPALGTAFPAETEVPRSRFPLRSFGSSFAACEGTAGFHQVFGESVTPVDEGGCNCSSLERPRMKGPLLGPVAGCPSLLPPTLGEVLGLALLGAAEGLAQAVRSCALGCSAAEECF